MAGVFHQNLLRSHTQSLVWNACEQPGPPSISNKKVCKYRLYLNISFLPIMATISIVVHVLKFNQFHFFWMCKEYRRMDNEEVSYILVCNCQAVESCKRGNCSSRSLQIACKIVCKCYESTNRLSPILSRKGMTWTIETSNRQFYSMSVFHQQFLISYILSVFLKFGSFYITGHWGSFNVKNATLCFHILSSIFSVFFF